MRSHRSAGMPMPIASSVSERRSFWALVGAVLLLAGVGVSAYRSQSVVMAANALRGHTREVLQDIEALQGFLVDVETSERGYVITGEEEYLQPYEHGAVGAP